MKKLTADRVIPGVVDLVFITSLMAFFNAVLRAGLFYIADLREAEGLDISYWDLAPITLTLFLLCLLLKMAGEVTSRPTQLPDQSTQPCPNHEKEEDQ
jgi:hypothetical protein